jgi:hypothetical protein
MTVWIVKHHAMESYAASAGYKPRIVHDRQQAWRFVTPLEAEKLKDRMPVPIAWVVIECQWSVGPGKLLD